MAAAWFQDVGYLTGSRHQHQQTGTTLATTFLQETGVSPAIIASVQGCIRATKVLQSPTSLLEEILCEADLFHLGQDTYRDKQKLMRKEQQQLTRTEVPGRDWRQQNIALFQSHRYFTTYAQALLLTGKADNFRRRLAKQAQKSAKPEPTTTYPKARVDEGPARR